MAQLLETCREDDVVRIADADSANSIVQIVDRDRDDFQFGVGIRMRARDGIATRTRLGDARLRCKPTAIAPVDRGIKVGYRGIGIGIDDRRNNAAEGDVGLHPKGRTSDGHWCAADDEVVHGAALAAIGHIGNKDGDVVDSRRRVRMGGGYGVGASDDRRLDNALIGSAVAPFDDCAEVADGRVRIACREVCDISVDRLILHTG